MYQTACRLFPYATPNIKYMRKNKETDFSKRQNKTMKLKFCDTESNKMKVYVSGTEIE